MKVSDEDREYWRKIARDSAELDKETGPGSPEHRGRILAHVNKLRAQIGMPPLVDEDEHPPELEFYARARARGLLRSSRQSD